MTKLIINVREIYINYLKLVIYYYLKLDKRYKKNILFIRKSNFTWFREFCVTNTILTKSTM